MTDRSASSPKLPHTEPPDLKARIVYIGLTIVFIAEFGKFVGLQVWNVIQPAVEAVIQLSKHQ